jgi:hypothetical protein
MVIPIGRDPELGHLAVDHTHDTDADRRDTFCPQKVIPADVGDPKALMTNASRPPPAELIVREFDLGTVQEPPTYVARGELGHVWRMRTEGGCWAVKRLTGTVEESTGEDVGFQLAVLASGAPIPRPVLSRDGAAIAVGPGRNRLPRV